MRGFEEHDHGVSDRVDNLGIVPQHPELFDAALIEQMKEEIKALGLPASEEALIIARLEQFQGKALDVVDNRNKIFEIGDRNADGTKKWAA